MAMCWGPTKPKGSGGLQPLIRSHACAAIPFTRVALRNRSSAHTAPTIPRTPKRATIGVNLYSQWKGFDARIRRPPKEIAANPKLVKAEEYAAILKRIENAEERLVVRLLHDT